MSIFNNVPSRSTTKGTAASSTKGSSNAIRLRSLEKTHPGSPAIEIGLGRPVPDGRAPHSQSSLRPQKRFSAAYTGRADSEMRLSRHDGVDWPGRARTSPAMTLEVSPWNLPWLRETSLARLELNPQLTTRQAAPAVGKLKNI